MPTSQTFTFVLFGATGDLAKRKIIPALYSLFETSIISESFQVIAYSRRPWTDDQYRDFIRPTLDNFPASGVDHFLQYVTYHQGTFEDHQSFQKLQSKITTDNVLYHLAIQPEFYHLVINNLGLTNLTGSILIEKPFGYDLESARVLEKQLAQYFLPENIFRIDHYLAKAGLEAVWEIRNSDFKLEQILQKDSVAQIHCRVVESIDILDRAEFYDVTGAWLDVGQNHSLEMLATLLMELPKAPEDIPGARAKALDQTHPSPAGTFIRGQYQGYLDHLSLASSDTETYFKVELASSDLRWQGVPLVLEGGKALAEKHSDITIIFKDGSTHVFNMEEPTTPEPYQTVIKAAINRDPRYFVSQAEMLALWNLSEKVSEQLKTRPLVVYPSGSHQI